MNTEILEQLERLAQAFPWEKVELDTRRMPEGTYTFMAVLSGDSDRGLQWDCASGETAQEAVREIIRKNPNRDPEKMRQMAIRALQEKIEKLKAVQFTIPPYIPNRELCERNPELSNYRPAKHATVDV